jgi:YD repeat-containing protein
VKTKYTVNAKGQVWRTRVGTDTAYIETFAEHSNAAALLTKTIDSRGKQVEYGYDDPNTRLNTDITDPKGNTTHYTYGVGGTVLLTPYIIFGVDKLSHRCVCYIEGYDEARTSKRLSREPSS